MDVIFIELFIIFFSINH